MLEFVTGGSLFGWMATRGKGALIGLQRSTHELSTDPRPIIELDLVLFSACCMECFRIHRRRHDIHCSSALHSEQLEGAFF